MKNLFYKLLLMDNSLILNFGDSQGEVYDYVFYNNINYKKYINNYSPGWRSGWSLRGLNKPQHENILFNSLYDISNNIFFNWDNICNISCDFETVNKLIAIFI